TPREEEPQISVPMVDVIAAMPGASPAEVENLVTRPIERRMQALSGVEHVYAMSGDGFAMVTVRFKVGENQEASVVKVHAKLLSDLDQSPPGALPPIVKPHSIDDVPVLALTLHSSTVSANALREVAVHLEDEIRTVTDVADTRITGGEPREMLVTLSAARLAASGVTPGGGGMAPRGANARLPAGGATVRVDVGAPLASAADVGSVIVAVRGGAPVAVRDVADVRDGYGETTQYVSHAEKGK